jgi:hypothetical protein
MRAARRHRELRAVRLCEPADRMGRRLCAMSRQQRRRNLRFWMSVQSPSFQMRRRRRTHAVADAAAPHPAPFAPAYADACADDNAASDSLHTVADAAANALSDGAERSANGFDDYVQINVGIDVVC